MARKIVFVVGTGRSGTHFLTRCLIAHREMTDLTDGQENRLVFNHATRLAAKQARPGDAWSLVMKYRLLRLRTHGRVLVDQSHPNLWNYGLLSRSFPDAIWLPLVRDPRAVVASMLNHRGVRARTEQWRDYRVPNPFLGITEQNLSAFENATIAGRCAYRWWSHARRTLELALEDQRVLPVSYEALVQEPKRTMEKVHRAVGVSQDVRFGFGANPDSLSKWKGVLSEEQVKEVCAIADEHGVHSELQRLFAGGFDGVQRG